MDLFFTAILFLLGLFLVSKGGDYFLDASIWIADAFKIPKVIVGATIVTIGTTLPEMIVSISASIKGNAELASSNAIGSITVNIGLILSILIIFLPFSMKRKTYFTKILLTFITILLLLYFVRDGILGTLESLVFIIIFAVFLLINIREAKLYSSDSDALHHTGFHQFDKDSAAATENHKSKRSMIINIIKFLFGAAGICFGSQLLIENGILLAKSLGISEVIIGFTAVGIGTSLPELVTAVKSLKKGKTSVSVGNIIGANIVDTTLILPLSSLFSEEKLAMHDSIVRQDIPVYIALISIVFIPALIKKRFSRWQGLLAAGIYIAYVIQKFFI